MTTSRQQDLDLASAVLNHIMDELTPGDVFGDDSIKNYAEQTFTPEELYGEDRLEEWAEANGYVKE